MQTEGNSKKEPKEMLGMKNTVEGILERWQSRERLNVLSTMYTLNIHLQTEYFILMKNGDWSEQLLYNEG